MFRLVYISALFLTVNCFESFAKRHGDYVEVPAGLMTNYDVCTEPNVTE